MNWLAPTSWRVCLVLMLLAIVAVACSTENLVGGQQNGQPPSSLTDSRLGESPLTSSEDCVNVDEQLALGAWVESEGPDGAISRVLDLESGQIRAGNFYDLSGEGKPGDPDFVAKIYWAPLDPEIAEDHPLLVRVENLDRRDQVVEVEVTTAAFGGGQYFWPSAIPLPDSGSWRLTATAPEHWACFELTVSPG
jgi:hypothetical protein